MRTLVCMQTLSKWLGYELPRASFSLWLLNSVIFPSTLPLHYYKANYIYTFSVSDPFPCRYPSNNILFIKKLLLFFISSPNSSLKWRKSWWLGRPSPPPTVLIPAFPILLSHFGQATFKCILAVQFWPVALVYLCHPKGHLSYLLSGMYLMNYWTYNPGCENYATMDYNTPITKNTDQNFGHLISFNEITKTIVSYLVSPSTHTGVMARRLPI